MSTKKPTKSSKNAQPVAVDESTEILRFGVKAYEEYARTFPPPSVQDLQISRLGDYLHHFGFSLERESHAQKRRTADMGAAAAAAGASSSPHPPATTPKARRNKNTRDVIGDDNEPTDYAAWGFPDAEKAEADAYAATLPSMPDSISTSHITTAIIAPYVEVSWRQNKLQCDLKKCRAIYLWLCNNVAIVMEKPPPPADGEVKLPPITTKKAKKPTKKELAAAQAAAAAQVVLDPLESALTSRTATPYVAACLLQALLSAAGISSDIVKGTRKGASPTDGKEWAWNIVHIDGKSYLVDVASSVYHGPMRNSMAESEQPTTTQNSTSTSKSTTPRGAASSSARSKNAPVVVPTVQVPDVSLDKGPRLQSSSSSISSSNGEERVVVEDFYFFTHPVEFAYSHLPDSEDHTLLVLPPSKVAWEVSPHLGPQFFRYGLRLSSHRRSCLMAVRTTPFYVTVENNNPGSVELCCLLYNSTLQDLPEDVSTATPMGPQWVWHQRQESTAEETFTLMAPVGAFYSLVIGARHIREDPYDCRVSSTELFTPVMRYQVKVNFASTTTPLLPRQHLSPCICRLQEPLTYQLQASTQHFAVMPACSNVAGVAVVSSKPVPPTEEEPNPPLQREVRAFLTFNAERVVYEGAATFNSGESAEVWVLYSAPDRNGLAFREKVAIAEKERPPTPPPPQPTRPGKKGKSAEPPGPTAEERERLRFRQSLDQATIFLPFVTHVEVKKFLPRDASDIVQPQPSIEIERGPTLRRLIGVTEELYEEATLAQQRRMGAVGAAFGHQR